MKLWKHYLALAAFMLVAAGPCLGASMGLFGFLRTLGIDMKNVALLTDAPFNGGDDAHGEALNTEQYKTLLNDVYHFDRFSGEELAEMEGNFFITGVRALPASSSLPFCST